MPLKVGKPRQKNLYDCDVELEIKNFGPIHEGRITVKPLTVFIGSNGSGKSYTSMLIYSILGDVGNISRRRLNVPSSFWYDSLGVYSHFDFDYEEKIPSDLQEPFSEFLKSIKLLKSGEELEIPDELLISIFERYLKYNITPSISENLIKLFSIQNLADLRTIGKRNFEIKISIDNLILQYSLSKGKGKNLSLQHFEGIMPTKVKVLKSGPPFVLRPDKRIIQFNKSYLEREKNEQIWGFITRLCIRNLSNTFSFRCFYLPAARSGILQGHKALAAAIIGQSSSFGIDDWEVPRFSVIISTFLTTLLQLQNRPGPFHEIATDFENEVAKGTIEIDITDKQKYPDFQFKIKNKNIPLSRSSSAISELSPLILYLKYRLKPGDILIIEEPEAHLHPKSQILLAKYFTRLVNKGLNLIITTHSDSLFEALNIHLIRGKLTAKEIKEQMISEDEILKPEQISAYVFSMDGKSESRIDSLSIDDEEGFPNDEFLKVQESLYDDLTKMRRLIIDK